MDNPEFVLLDSPAKDKISMHEIAEEAVETAIAELMCGFQDAAESLGGCGDDPHDPYMQGRRLFTFVMQGVNTGVWLHTHEHGDSSEISGKREKTEPGEWTPEGFEATV